MFIAPDEPEYLEIAQNIAQGNGFSFHGEPTAYRDFLFPAVSGGVIALFGNPHAVFYLHHLLDLAIALLLFQLARRWFSERTAVFVAGAWLLYPAAILFTALFLTETLFVFLWVLALFIYDQAQERTAVRRYLLLGLVLGLLLLTRATGMILALAMLLHLMFHRRYRPAMVILGVMFLTILPWILRNSVVMETFTLNTNSGINLYQGSNSYATGAYRFDEPVTAPLEFDRLNEVERNRRAMQLSFNYLRSHPLEAFALWPKKFAYFWSTDMSLWAHYRPQPGSSLAASLRSAPIVLLALTGLVYILITAGGAAGLILVKTTPLRGVFFGQLLLATLAALATYGLARYHFPLMPALLLSAASLEYRGAWREPTLAKRVVTILVLAHLFGIWLTETLIIITG